MIYGGRGSGRSTLVFQTIITTALKSLRSLLLFTDSYASLRRLRSIASSKWSDLSDLILIVPIREFREQDTLIDDLEIRMPADMALLVFDSITSCYRAALREREDNIILNKQLNRELAIIKYLTMRRRIATVITSDVTSLPEEKGLQPVASQILTYWSDRIIRLDRLQRELRRVTVVKPPPAREALLRIGPEGFAGLDGV